MDNLPFTPIPGINGNWLPDGRFQKTNCEPGCTAQHHYDEPYCIVETSEHAIPEAPGGLGAAVISSGTLDTPETLGTLVAGPDAQPNKVEGTFTGTSVEGLKVGMTAHFHDQLVKITKVEGLTATFEYFTGRRQKRRQFVVHSQRTLPRVKGCGHKLDLKNEPRHRNCKACWTAFFRNQDGLPEKIAKLLVETPLVYEARGPKHPAEFKLGRKFLTRFHAYVTLLQRVEALQQAYLEEENVRKQLAKDSIDWADPLYQSLGSDAEESFEVG